MGHPNIYTYDIAEYLEIPLDIAEEIQNVIDTYFYLDWSECETWDKNITFIAAYEFYKTELKK